MHASSLNLWDTSDRFVFSIEEPRYSVIETRFPIGTLEGCARSIETPALTRNCFRVLRTLSKKFGCLESIISELLSCARVGSNNLCVWLYKGGLRDVGLLSEWNKRQARNDLAFDTKDGFLYHPSQFIVTQILRTFLETFRKTNINFSSLNISNTTILQYEIKKNFLNKV